MELELLAVDVVEEVVELLRVILVDDELLVWEKVVLELCVVVALHVEELVVEKVLLELWVVQVFERLVDVLLVVLVKVAEAVVEVLVEVLADVELWVVEDVVLELVVADVVEELVEVLLEVLVDVELPVVEDVLIEVCVDVVVDLEVLVVENVLLELRVEVVELDVVVENVVELLVLDELEVLDALDVVLELEVSDDELLVLLVSPLVYAHEEKKKRPGHPRILRSVLGPAHFVPLTRKRNEGTNPLSLGDAIEPIKICLKMLRPKKTSCEPVLVVDVEEPESWPLDVRMNLEMSHSELAWCLGRSVSSIQTLDFHGCSTSCEF